MRRWAATPRTGTITSAVKEATEKMLNEKDGRSKALYQLKELIEALRTRTPLAGKETQWAITLDQAEDLLLRL